MKKQSGTTTVALIGRDCVVLAAESKATISYLVASKEAKKIYPITNRIAATIAGSVGDAQTLMRILKAEAKLYELENGEVTVNAMATLLANILQSSRIFPYITEVILGGVDSKGRHIYDVDPLGGVLEERKFIASGSGSPIALGVLEELYEEGMEREEVVEVAIKAIKAAVERDVYSGGRRVELAVIDENGIEPRTIELELSLKK